MTHISTCIFQGLFKNLVYRSVDLATKKIWAMFPMGPLNLKKIVSKNPSNYYLLKVGKFHGDSVKNKSARTKKTTGGGGWRLFNHN